MSGSSSAMVVVVTSRVSARAKGESFLTRAKGEGRKVLTNVVFKNSNPYCRGLFFIAEKPKFIRPDSIALNSGSVNHGNDYDPNLPVDPESCGRPS